jgi:hypothetical protein
MAAYDSAEIQQLEKIALGPNLVFLLRERPLMTSHIRVGRGVQDSPQKGTL